MRRAVAACMAAVSATACTLLERPAAPGVRGPVSSAPSPAAVAVEPAAAIELVEYLARLRGLPEPALAAEAVHARQAAARTASDVAFVKAALVLSLAREPEDGDIVALVEPVVKRETSDPGVRAVASFLHVNAQERRRLRESAAVARAALRDERRTFEAQKQRADSLQERAAQLQQKLDALTALEKSLSDRQVPTR